MPKKKKPKNPNLLKFLSWEIIYTVRNFKDGGYNIYKNGKLVTNLPKDLTQTQKGLFLYYTGILKRHIHLRDAQGWVSINNKSDAISSIYYHIRTVDRVFQKDKELLEKAAKSIIDDLYERYQEDTKSFIPKSILKKYWAIK